MAITTTTAKLRLDESAGLQNALVTASPPGDADDNDIAIASLPSAFATRLTTLNVTPTEAAESGYNGSNSGADIVSVTPDGGATITGLSFAKDSSGNPLPAYGGTTAGVDSGIQTTSGREIFLYVDSTNNNIVYGAEGNSDGTANPNGKIAFAVYLQETTTSGAITGAKMWTVISEPLKHPDANNPDDSLDLTNKLFVAAEQSLQFSAANAPSGQNLFIMFASTDGTKGIVAIGMQPADQSAGANVSTGDTVNSSQAGGPTTFGSNAQMLKPKSSKDPNGDGLWFTFVSQPNQDFTVPNLTATEANLEQNILYDSFLTASEASFDVVQLQSGKSAVVEITAVNSKQTADGNAYVNGVLSDFNNLGATGLNDITPNITKVILSGSNSATLTPGSPNGGGVTATFNTNGSVTLSGILAGTHIDYTTSGDHNRVLIRNAGSGSGNGSAAFDIGGFQITSVTSTSTEVGSHVFFEDDGPSVTLSGNSQTVTDDESALATDNSASFAGVFSVSYGADGQASSGNLSYALSTAGGSSNLKDTATGTTVAVLQDGANVVGVAGTTLSDPIVFVISVDSATGVVKLDQRLAVVHSDATDPNDSVTLSGTNLVKLTATATDGDGDPGAKTADITSSFKFLDDAPTVSLTTNSQTVTDDESALATNNFASFSGLFSVVSYGADGPGNSGNLSYALSTAGGSSNLTDTGTGKTVVMLQSGANVVGVAGTTLADPTVFVISVDSTTGVVTLDQQRAVVHSDATNPNDSVTLSGTGLVKLTATATDGDGDTGAKTADITSSFKFLDDGPTIAVEDSSGTFKLGAQGTWTEAPGADGFKSLSLTLNSFEIDTHGTVTATSSNSSLTKTDNFHYSGSITADFINDGVANNQTVQFTLTFDPSAGPPPTYDFELTTPPTTQTTISTANGSLDAGGPDPVRTLTIGSNSIVFSAVNALAPVSGSGSITSFLDANESTVQGQATYLSPAQMNVSTAGIGLGNNNFDGNANTGVDGATTQGGAFDESFVIDPTKFLVSSMKVYIDNSVGGYDTSSEDLWYRTYTRNADNSVTASGFTKVGSGDLKSEAGGQKSFVIPSVDNKNDLDAVQLAMGKGTVKIPVIEFNISQTFNPEPLKVNLSATIADGDNDTKSDGFAITVANA